MSYEVPQLKINSKLYEKHNTNSLPKIRVAIIYLGYLPSQNFKMNQLP